MISSIDSFAIRRVSILHFSYEADAFELEIRTHSIRMELREIGWDGVEWIHLAQDRNQWWAVVNTVMNLRVS
jgi:hypothetical protein